MSRFSGLGPKLGAPSLCPVDPEESSFSIFTFSNGRILRLYLAPVSLIEVMEDRSLENRLIQVRSEYQSVLDEARDVLNSLGSSSRELVLERTRLYLSRAGISSERLDEVLIATKKNSARSGDLHIGSAERQLVPSIGNSHTAGDSRRRKRVRVMENPQVRLLPIGIGTHSLRSESAAEIAFGSDISVLEPGVLAPALSIATSAGETETINDRSTHSTLEQNKLLPSGQPNISPELPRPQTERLSRRKRNRRTGRNQP